MTQFNPENKVGLTNGEALDPAMKITDREDAKQYLEAYIEYLNKNAEEEHRKDFNAEQVAKSNIGYWAGYYDKEVYARVLDLFDTSHSFFGKHSPTSEQAFKAGIQAGKQAKRQTS